MFSTEQITNMAIRLSQINGIMPALESFMDSSLDMKKKEGQTFANLFYLLWELLEDVETDFNTLTTQPRTVNIKCELTGSF